MTKMGLQARFYDRGNLSGKEKERKKEKEREKGHRKLKQAHVMDEIIPFVRYFY